MCDVQLSALTCFLQNAKAMLLRAIHIAPVDFQLRFNVALTMQVGVLTDSRHTESMQSTMPHGIAST
jgi:hypothetical protein